MAENIDLPDKLRILTVGDGDFSCSLALMRAYPLLIQQLVATSLLRSEKDVVEIYPQASNIIQSLSSFDNIEIIYGVDATKLHKNLDLSEFEFDCVMFHHPHLGYDDNVSKEETEQENVPSKGTQSNEIQAASNLSKRHECLLTHYMCSSKLLLNMNKASKMKKYDAKNLLPCIHLCLCASSIENWNVLEVVNQVGLQFAWESPTAAASPLLSFYEKLRELKIKSNYQMDDLQINPNIEKRLKECKRAKRKGHWLGRYGYRHQATFPNSTHFGNFAISNSYHIFLTQKVHMQCSTCHVCGHTF
ncbi:hypothetical protein HJC23_008851 [Cyclotella cryptica]|uniref:25S rRNA (uridine-N(3))-methyltransferase BMT5-like domain-containing protein n=1 Tax=Cyclotella cryptica TaxID=29204 RepID=A0ABD3Q983_9STRA|eukprot:CCRYP_007503-RA/>CCRYP_007503-RA protein AED:0.27 eAED:0.27 QI:0/-1/0/1/-1/1/1/0/302